MEDLVAGCTGKSCDYAIDELAGDIACVDGGGTCANARMLSGDPTTTFHDTELEAASLKIQGILDGLQSSAAGRKLAFLTTDEGLFLAWVDHSKPESAGSIKRKDGHAKVAKALKIK